MYRGCSYCWSTGNRSSILGEAYRLVYPGRRDQVQKDEAQSCGFGPHNRDDVGLWISLMPINIDTDLLADERPKLMSKAIPRDEGGNVRHDPTLRHHAVKADVTKEGEAGHSRPGLFS